MMNNAIKFSGYSPEIAATGFEIARSAEPVGSCVPIHRHDYYEFTIVTGGNARIRIEGRTYPLGPGSIVLLDPAQFHQPLQQSEAPFERTVLRIGHGVMDEDLSGMFSGPCDVMNTGADHFESIRSLCSDLISSGGTDDRYSRRYRISLLQQLLITAARLPLSCKAEPEEDPSPLVSQALDRISADFRKPLSLDELADSLYVSKYYLSHKFSQELGIGIYQFILAKRLMLAKAGLDGGCTPQQACVDSGFTDYTNFYRSFKKMFGISPRDYLNSK